MLKTIALFLVGLVNFNSYGQSYNPAPYCPKFLNYGYMGYGGAILNVSLGSLNNSSGINTDYTYYNNVLPPILYKGHTYTLSIVFDTVLNNSDNSWYAIGFDFNHTGSVIDYHFMATPIISGNVNTTNTPVTVSIAITIPNSANTGIGRMRIVRFGLTSQNYGPAVCDNSNPYGLIGETEDYDINIADCVPPASITGIAIVCKNSTTLLSNSVPDGTWTSDNTNVATVNPITGLVTGNNVGSANISYSTNCGADASIPIVVNEPPSAITGAMSLDVGTTTLLSNAVGGGNWSSNYPAIASINNSGLVTGISAGIATISYATPGCPPSAFNITVNIPVSVIEENTQITNVTIYPNPATSMLYINSISSTNEIIISEIWGKRVYSHEFHQKNIELNIGALPPGIYIVKVNGEVKRLIKE